MGGDEVWLVALWEENMEKLAGLLLLIIGTYINQSTVRSGLLLSNFNYL